ncbi:MAG: DUF2442 domain-containing protein [Nitrospirales bacterium]
MGARASERIAESLAVGRSARTAEEDCSTRIEPPKGDSITKITRVQIEPSYQLRVEFSDGAAGTVDLSSRLFGPIFEPLKDPAVFAQAHIDEFCAITWLNGADLATDALHQTLLPKNPLQPSKVRTP